ncbi:MAG: inorganic diphosphatase [Candidatus Aenigmatarchaeota archaeon]
MDISKVEPGDKYMVNVFVESTKGSTNYYKYNKKMGLFTLNKILESPFPGCYGFIPRTHHIDAKPLDVLLLTSGQIQKGTVVPSKPIGLIRLRAEIPDDILVAVPLADKEFDNVTDLSTINKETLDNFKMFLEQFKQLKVENIYDSERAKKAVRRAIELYKRSLIR